MVLATSHPSSPPTPPPKRGDSPPHHLKTITPNLLNHSPPQHFILYSQEHSQVPSLSLSKLQGSRRLPPSSKTRHHRLHHSTPLLFFSILQGSSAPRSPWKLSPRSSRELDVKPRTRRREARTFALVTFTLFGRRVLPLFFLLYFTKVETTLTSFPLCYLWKTRLARGSFAAVDHPRRYFHCRRHQQPHH